MTESARSFKVLDLSGYGFSGKHALSDLVREFAGYQVPHFAFEFNLLRIQGGILDLERAFVDDWSLIRSAEAVRRFKRLIVRLGTPNRWTRPTTWFQAAGPGYDVHFKGRFTELGLKYVDGLVLDSWRTNWPYPRADLSGFEVFTRKLLRKLGVTAAEDFDVYLAATDDFAGATRAFLRELLGGGLADHHHTVVLHNAFEPFNPERCLKFFDEARCIVVDRDARDNFAQHWLTPYRPMHIDVERFVTRYRVYHEASRRFDSGHPAVLRINFEELVERYDETLGRIFEHLGEDSGCHVARQAYFDPSVSRKNVGIWRAHPRQDEIRFIENELPEYCVEF